MKRALSVFLNIGKLVPAALLVLSVSNVFAQDVKLKTTKVRDNVYMISGAGGNVAASVGKDGVLVIDSFVPGVDQHLAESLSKLSNNPLRYLLNTHWHGDHTGGNAKLGPKVPIIAHDNARSRLMHDQKNFFGEQPAAPKAALPVLTFNDQMTLYFNDDTVKLKHYPTGHTDGDSMIYFVKANVLHMGDQYFKDMYPFVDLTTGGNVAGLAKNIAKVIKEMPADVMIIPGHGGLANLDDLKAYHQMLKTTIKTVKHGIKTGLSLADIQQKGLGADMEMWRKGFLAEKDWIDFTYHSLKQGATHKHDDVKTHHH